MGGSPKDIPGNRIDIGANLDAIRKRIDAAAAGAGREPGSVRLVAVSKFMSLENIRTAMQAGQHCFAENTVQEARQKQALLDEPANEWHFIGHLQSNKAGFIPGNFHWLHTLDSLKLARKLSTAATATATKVRTLVQVNIANDPAKSGLPAAGVMRFIEELLEADLGGLELRGLMTIGKLDMSASQRRRDFADMNALGQRCAERFGSSYFNELSMGMSADFEDAIAAGATMVRIGSAIFGPRPSV